MSTHRTSLSKASIAAVAVVITTCAAAPATSQPAPPESTARAAVRAPIVCTNGPGGRFFEARLTMPSTARAGSTYPVRIDAVPSGTISHFGLNFIHDMATEYGIPEGTTVVSGSLRIVPDTGTENVKAGAFAVEKDGRILMSLPARVDSGSSYTPPSIELRLQVTAKPDTLLKLTFLQYRVTANAVIVGDVHTSCDPDPNPFVMGKTMVTAPAPP